MSSLLDAIAKLCTQSEAISDIHVHVGQLLEYRDELGEMCQYKDCTVDAADVVAICEAESEGKLRELLKDKGGEHDLTAYVGEFRFRAQVYFHAGAQVLGLALRRIHATVPTIEALRLPPGIKEWADRRTGLILVTGPSGSGKTSTLAAIVNYINQSRRSHVILIEDPIEYLHNRNASLITQREVGGDAKSFSSSLRAALRQNPDVIVVGEIRDRDTMETALFASETGHLVLATLHSTSASRAPERVIDFFAEDLRALARSQLASTLVGVVAQVLVPKADKSGKLLACECLTVTKEAGEHIRSGRFGALDNVMLQPNGLDNMWTLNTRLAELVFSGDIHAESALAAAYNRIDMLERIDNRDVQSGSGSVVSFAGR